MTLIGCGRDRGINNIFRALLFNGQIERIGGTFAHDTKLHWFEGILLWYKMDRLLYVQPKYKKRNNDKKYKLQSQVTIWQNALSFDVVVLLLFLCGLQSFWIFNFSRPDRHRHQHSPISMRLHQIGLWNLASNSVAVRFYNSINIVRLSTTIILNLQHWNRRATKFTDLCCWCSNKSTISNHKAYLEVILCLGVCDQVVSNEILAPHISNLSQCKPMPNRAKESFRFVRRSLLDSNDLPIALNVCLCARWVFNQMYFSSVNVTSYCHCHFILLPVFVAHSLSQASLWPL